jgi:hypothetical protein
MWQDITIAIISIIFDIVLIPQIIFGFKSKRKTIACSTALVTFIGVYATTLIYFTLQLYLTTLTSLIGGTLWFILFIQSVKYKKN